MGLRVNTNVASINAQRSLSNVTERLSGNFRRLSTGLRISTAADDAAGLAISERLRSQVRSLEQAKRNANDGISFVQTAEGALNEVSSILTRLRELAIQSANGSVSNADKDTLDEEFQSLIGEVNRIGRSTEFNGVKLLDGSASLVSFQVGFGTTAGIDTLSVSLSAALSTSLALNSLDIGSGGVTTTALTNIDTAINTVSALRGSLGAVQNRLGSTINNLAIQVENLSAAESRIRDVDVAYETAQLTRNSILQQASISVLS
ncbi:MAG TPA: flagellin, partial [Planctomycetota bacterium]|nr:flagellin [Planctomycetota bacterium]